MMMEKWNEWKKLQTAEAWKHFALYVETSKCESNQRVKDAVPTSSPIFLLRVLDIPPQRVPVVITVAQVQCQMDFNICPRL
jgi:hypothetical protein